MTRVFAHRGWKARAAENTLAAFAEARLLGADGVELDVRLSADQALVVHHDPVLEGGGVIAELGVGDLPESVPLLAEALAVCEGMVVNVEIKNLPHEPGFDPSELIAGLVAATVVEAGWVDQVLVSSFSTATLDAVRVADPRLALGWLLPVAAVAPECLERAADAGYEALHPFVTQVDSELTVQARELGLGVNVWTVNAREDLVKMVELGVDGVITDRPDEALAVVAG
jgi:glycerophosphoryl diester phosphodiesterase